VSIKRVTLVLLVLAVVSACARLQLYEGPEQSRSEVARIIADPKINAGLPMVAVLREVDDRVINWNVNTVDVLPGEHRLLVDCEIGSSTTRFEIKVKAIAGYRYRTQIEVAPGNHVCQNVTLVESY